MIRDPELIKEFTVKQFDHLSDHKLFMDPENDTLLGNSVAMMKGEKWRDMRSTLSPIFTSSKMKQMFELIVDYANEVIPFLEGEARSGKHLQHEMREFFSRTGIDIIATCAFGLKVNSFENPNNEVFLTNSKIFKFDRLSAALRLTLSRMMPGLMKRLGFELFEYKVKKFFQSTVLGTMKIRKEKNIVRHDMINLMMQARTGHLRYDEGSQKETDGFATVQESDYGKGRVKREWSDDEIVAQCFGFFLGGFDTTSNTLQFLTYELAVHPEIQQKLYEEICSVSANLKDNRLTYELLQRMKYMDQVMCEVLRKWSAIIVTDRLCVKNFTHVNGERTLNIEKGMLFWLPIHAIHRDPKYWPEPEKFDPERFSDENKGNIKPYTYIPFSSGPRNCIGNTDSDFSIMCSELMDYYFLR